MNSLFIICNDFNFENRYIFSFLLRVIIVILINKYVYVIILIQIHNIDNIYILTKY